MNAAASLFLAVLVGAPELDRPGDPRPEVKLGIQDRYDPVPVQGNLDAFLKQLLRRADEDQEIEKLFQQLRVNPMFGELSPRILEEMKGKARDAMFRPELLELIARQKNGGLTLDDLQKLLERFNEMQTDGVALPPMQGGDWAPTAPPDDRLARLAKDWLNDMDQSRAGDFLRDSPAWRNGLRDLDRLVQGSNGRFDWLKRGMPDHWRVPNEWAPRLGQWAAKLPGMPNLPRVSVGAPNLGRWNLNFGAAPRIGAPSVGGINVSENLLWLLAPLLVVMLAWLFYRNLGRAPALANLTRRRGPWPVDPAAVVTRSQLIQAFDYLALLLLGDEVRTWNHVAVAKKLGEEAARSPVADALARLYELARYTPGDDVLAPEAQADARRCLMTLAGSAAA